MWLVKEGTPGLFILTERTERMVRHMPRGGEAHAKGWRGACQGGGEFLRRTEKFFRLCHGSRQQSQRPCFTVLARTFKTLPYFIPLWVKVEQWLLPLSTKKHTCQQSFSSLRKKTEGNCNRFSQFPPLQSLKIHDSMFGKFFRCSLLIHLFIGNSMLRVQHNFKESTLMLYSCNETYKTYVNISINLICPQKRS